MWKDNIISYYVWQHIKCIDDKKRNWFTPELNKWQTYIIDWIDTTHWFIILYLPNYQWIYEYAYYNPKRFYPLHAEIKRSPIIDTTPTMSDREIKRLKDKIYDSTKRNR